MAAVPGPLCWVHFGDLHLTRPEAENFGHFMAMVDDVNACLDQGVAFAYLPGDNADDGTAEQFRLVRQGLDRLRLPHHVLSGDHDFNEGDLENFYGVLGARVLPYAITAQGCRCLFLDIVSNGSGGPDFRLGTAQAEWVETQLSDAAAEGERIVVFMHAYPADLASGSAQLTALFARHAVCLVDMGHTHYNELGNDGTTIFAATRSTGQIEEGPPGYSIVALDCGAVSWRFKPLAEAWPVAMITSPADGRLATRSTPAGPPAEVRALAWPARDIVSVELQADDGAWHPMTQVGGALWSAALPAAGHDRLTVRARDRTGVSGEDCISLLATVDRSDPPDPQGSDAHAIGAWPERHLLGTQLGPNRNGRAW